MEQKAVNLILIETSTSLCSVALCRDGELVAYEESKEPKAQASLTAPFVQNVLQKAGLSIKDCDGVCVSSGPGSYTGLRVGVSTAKGLCFGAKLPLFALSTMDILREMGGDVKYIVPMIDARRMEVYCAVYKDGVKIVDTAPLVVDENSFADILTDGEVLFIGDGAGKCADVIKHPNARFVQCFPNAKAMTRQAHQLFLKGKSEDVAYFEPFYLKDFIATVSKKSLF